jgi:hypothetical protein
MPTGPRRTRRHLTLVLALALLSGRAGAQTLPALDGPIPGTPFVAATSFDLGVVDYEQLEYFVAGTAAAFSPTGAFLSDGRWDAAPSATAEYRTRIVVHRPTKRGRFNGTVVVEWLNVSGGVDAGPDWIALHTELIRKGYAWVGVTAQKVGIDGGAAIPGLPPNHLKLVDPVRYGELMHPGDSFSYDMYSQVARLLRAPAETNPLGDLRVKTLLAAGESQSAFRMVTYINAVHALDPLYDGFLVHSRGGGAAPLSEPPLGPPTTMPSPALIREDVGVPVLTFQTETDLGFLGFTPARQPDSQFHRLWEVAGTAHADVYTVETGMSDLGRSPEAAAVREVTDPLGGIFSCSKPLNSGPQHFVLKAALHALHEWVKRGKAPDSAPRLELDPKTLAIQRDEHGNALGGIRTPYVDAPIATLRGDG